MPDEYPIWPPAEYDTDTWPFPWLRYETEYPGSGRPSRLVSHSFVPYVATLDNSTDPVEIQNGLKRVAAHYVHRLHDVLDVPSGANRLGLPAGWKDALSDDNIDSGEPGQLAWLDIWPPIDVDDPGDVPYIASWNLSRQHKHALPGTVVMVASEIYVEDLGVASYSFGLRVPMSVKKEAGRIEVTIRSMTAEYPREGFTSFTEMFADAGAVARAEREKIQSNILGVITTPANKLEFAKAGYVDAETVVHEEFGVQFGDPVNFVGTPFTVTYWSKASGSPEGDDTVRPKFPAPESYRITSKYRFDSGADNEMRISTDTFPLVTHAADPGEAEVFVQTPSGWVDPMDPAKPYKWTMRRPVREDEILDRYRLVRAVKTHPDIELIDPGFVIRRCPDYVPEDRSIGPGNKSVNLPGGEVPEPRRNAFSAVMAFCNARDFFELLGHFDLKPWIFVVRAKKDIEIYYRYGIVPGPGRDGKTINAQVALESEDALAFAGKPTIKMHLALANLARWSRPVQPDGKRKWAEPLGIASSGRWMMHEFGHYLLAARLGKLEFDFAHSAGDAMAAVHFDPHSRLGDTRGDMPESFRGITYPFVFTTRRHDRSPLLGWAWYGTLNRSVIQAPPAGCDVYKGYLTEQILSSSIFRLYRSLGGDTMAGNAPDRYVRYRASFMTMFLLVRAIIGLAQSPSKAEMLELGLEDTGLLMTNPLVVPPLVSVPPPPPDEWGGGTTHKVVRWAFETQGMFPQDEEQVTNTPGQPPPVDIYIRDQRPLEVPDIAGRTVYGPGSYAPVSLDWDGERLWTVSSNGPFRVGNRGKIPSGSISARLWVGVLRADTSVDRWDLAVNGIVWTGSIALVPIQSKDPLQEEELQLPDLTDEITVANNTAAGPIVLLLEISSNLDLANSDSDVFLASSIAIGSNPPTVPRAVTDLVANDNNLGLMIL